MAKSINRREEKILLINELIPEAHNIAMLLKTRAVNQGKPFNLPAAFHAAMDRLAHKHGLRVVSKTRLLEAERLLTI